MIRYAALSYNCAGCLETESTLLKTIAHGNVDALPIISELKKLPIRIKNAASGITITNLSITQRKDCL